MNTMPIAASMLPEFDHEMKTTRRLLERVPDAIDLLELLRRQRGHHDRPAQCPRGGARPGRDGDRGEVELGCDDGVGRVGQAGPAVSEDVFACRGREFGVREGDGVEPVEDRKLLSEAIGGMVSSLDPHSVYLDKKAYREMRESMQGRFVGLGIEVSMEDGYVKIVSPIEDSPAYRAGIKPGDLITRIDSTPIKGLSLDESIKKMRGAPGSKVALTIARKGEDKPLAVTLVREEIRVHSVKGKIVEPGYAWLRISQFQELTLDELAQKAGALYAIGGCPVHESPLHLVPHSMRASCRNTYGIDIAGELCPHCRARLEDQFAGDFMQMPVERFFVSESGRSAIARW